MLTKLMPKIAAVCVFASVISAHQAGAVTVVFQNGLNDYTGTRDTYISAAASQQEKNYGTANKLILRAGSTPRNILISFDINSLPENLCIDSATLSLYKLRTTVDPIGSAYKIISGPWAEGNGGSATLGDVDWNHRIHGRTSPLPVIPNIAWNSPGLGAGTDYEIPAVDSENLTINGWYDWDVTSILQDWYEGTDPNYGIVFKATGDTPFLEFASSENGHSYKRPKLIINYHPDCGIIPEPESLSLLGFALLGLFKAKKIKYTHWLRASGVSKVKEKNRLAL